MLHTIRTPELVGFQFDQPTRCLSSAVLNGGFAMARSIVNLHVHKGYSGGDPAGDIRAVVDRLGLPGPAVGLMTAVRMDQAVYLAEEGVHVLATAGVGNAEAAGITPPWTGGPGTINILAYIEGRADDAALAGACITLTEAKVRALAARGVRCGATGEPATGTTTDAVAIASSGAGAALPYLGPGTAKGFRLARLAYEAITRSLDLTRP